MLILKQIQYFHLSAMEKPDIKRLVVTELNLPINNLREVDPARKKELHSWGEKSNTIIVDYGSETIKAGYEQSTDPELIFRPHISKNRDLSKSDLPVKAFVNTSYDQLDFSKNNFKSPYERNIVLHFSLIEQCNDYIFAQLLKNNKRIRNPLIITETLANPLHCRASFLEQIFECYELDSIMIGTDALFAYFFELDCSISRYESETALLINFGATSIHLVAMVKGKIHPSSVCRINIGGNNSFQLFSRSILLKNPHFKDKINYSFMRQLYQNFTSVAIDFREQLKFFQSSFKHFPKTNFYVNKIQEENKQHVEELPFVSGIELDFDLDAQIPEDTLKRKEEVRKRMSQKLKDSLNRRKEMKKKMNESDLQNLYQLRARYQTHDKEAHEEAVEMFGDHHPFQKLEKKIKSLEVKLGLVEEKGEDTKFNLISIPDHELPPEKLKYKKLQIYQKQAIEIRKQKQQEKEDEQVRVRELRENNPEIYLHQLKESYKNLSQKIKNNQRIKSELSNPKSRLSQIKKQTFARLAEQEYDSEVEQGEHDWLVFKDLEESDHYSELEAMEAQLREIDPEWTQAKDNHHLKESNQLFLLNDLVKCHQIYFQPQLIGVNQIDLVKAIVRLIDEFPAGIQTQLRGNIVLLGGGSTVQGLSQRIQRDLIRESPFGSRIKVKVGKGGAEGAFRGMQYIAKYEKELLERYSFKKDEFLAKREKYFVENPWSNPEPRI